MKLDNDAIKKSMLLYAITDRGWLKEGETLESVVEDVLKSGATFLQLREKIQGHEEIVKTAINLQTLCKKYNVPFVVNDDIMAAKEIDADILLILTAVDKVCLNYNTDHVRELDSLTIDEAYKYIEENQFAKGSMLPKIEACIEFVKDNNKMAIISSLEKASDAINNKNGTVITRR